MLYIAHAQALLLMALMSRLNFLHTLGIACIGGKAYVRPKGNEKSIAKETQICQ